MHLLDRRSIRTKVVAAFALVLVCTVALGLFAINRLDGVNANAQEIRDNQLPSIRILGHMAPVAERLRSNQGSEMLANTDAEREHAASVIKAQEEVYRKERQDYQPLIAAGEEQRLVVAFDAAWKRYGELSETFAGLNVQGKRHEAIELYTNGMSSALATYRDALQAAIAFNVREGQQVADAGAALGTSAFRWILTALVLTTLMCVGVGWAMIRSVSAPITAMTDAMRRLAGRELTVEIVGPGRGDEIGAMAKAVQVFKDNMVQADRLATEQAAERAANEQRASRLTALVQTFEARVSDLIRHVSSSAAELEGTANAMTATAGQTNQQAAGVASAAEQASVNVQTVASAAEQLTASISEITRQVAQSSKIAGKAFDDARRTDGVVRALAEGAKKIGDVVGLINTIAAQTNLLPLFLRISRYIKYLRH